MRRWTSAWLCYWRSVTKMLDVHVIVSPDTPREWVSQCTTSVRLAAKLAGFPVGVHQLAAVDGHIGEGRAAGYAIGLQPYVTCVDDDDYVLPHAFAQMRDALESGASAVFTPEVTLQNDCFAEGRKRHHLIAYRRGDIIDHTQWPCCGDVAQMRGIDGVELPLAAYVHRIYLDSKARVMRRSRQDELEMARG